MCFVFSLIPMTVVVVVAYFVLFSSTKAEGGMRTFGRILGVWLLLIALMFPLGGAFMAFSGSCPMSGGEWDCPMKKMMMEKQMPPPSFMPPAQ